MKILTFVTKRGHIFNTPMLKVSEQEQEYDFEEMVRKVYDGLKLEFSFDEFVKGMKEEFEHEDVTQGDIVMTAKIAIAHLKEDPEYYSKIELALAKGGPGSGRHSENGGQLPKEFAERNGPLPHPEGGQKYKVEYEKFADEYSAGRLTFGQFADNIKDLNQRHGLTQEG